MSVPVPLRPRKLLQSWKEISTYLGVTVRTVQRWEKEAGLPVRRPGGGQKARVIAYSDELDAWLGQDKAVVPGLLSRIPWRYVFPVAASLIVGLALVLLYAFRESEPVRVAVEGSQLRAYDSRNRLCWQKTFPPLGPQGFSANQAPLLIDVDNDGRKEVLFNFVPDQAARMRGQLICYEPDGSLRWSFRYGREVKHGDRRFNVNYVGQFVRLVHSGSRAYVLTVANHHLWYPCQVALLDPSTGKLLEEYWHPGALFRLILQDLDADGIDELLLAGLNNPGQGLGYAVLTILKVPFSAMTPRPEARKSPFFDFTRGREYAYLLFPRLDVLSAEGDLPLINEMAVTPDRQILIRVSGSEVHAFYYLDFKVNLTDSRFADNLAAVHDRLWRTGLLDHKISAKEIETFRRVARFPTAPDGNSPEIEPYLENAQSIGEHRPVTR